MHTFAEQLVEMLFPVQTHVELYPMLADFFAVVSHLYQPNLQYQIVLWLLLYHPMRQTVYRLSSLLLVAVQQPVELAEMRQTILVPEYQPDVLQDFFPLLIPLWPDENHRMIQHPLLVPHVVVLQHLHLFVLLSWLYQLHFAGTGPSFFVYLPFLFQQYQELLLPRQVDSM